MGQYDEHFEKITGMTTDWKIRIRGKRNGLSKPDQTEDLEKREYVSGFLSDRWIYKRIRMM